ncbi:hypothetical protein SGF_04913 [Shigella flexneri CDC 796-83]|uniref:Uncharacterized protein n=1 Tax=Shigella flexneri CDC 796-83 TaxID=945360 RepID=A0A6N3QEF3_SHIFL|nr:hypothetical protein SGF_04913 [Shigella flexneri CDC 796-83]
MARLCWDSPGQARINGVSLRAVSSLPRTPNAVNAQLSFDGAPAVSQAVNRSQTNSASEPPRVSWRVFYL